ncbi:MAG: tripartite tricarboxylate transporter substrate-binding protein [Vicinamibacterales bacterium]
MLRPSTGTHHLLALAACLLWCGTATAVQGQELDPTRPLILVAPANPGGGWDQTARLIQQVLTTQGIVSAPIEVLNRGGAGGTIGLAELVTRQRRNPHVIMVGGSVMLGAIVMHESAFTLRDTVPIARLISEYEVIAVPASSPFQTLNDLIAAFIRAPESISWAGGSAGGLDQILVGLLAQRLGIDPRRARYVAFTGGGEAAAAVMGGQVAAGVSGYGEWKALARSGRMRLLATSAPQRGAGDQPPTLRELGLDLVLSNFRCVVAPPGISPLARQALVDTLERMHATPAWREILNRNEWEDSFLTGSAFEAFLDREMLVTAATLRQLGLGRGGEGYALVGPWFVPWFVAGGLALSLAWMRLRRAAPSARLSQPRLMIGPATMSALLLVLYALSFEYAGFPAATAAYLACQARVLGSTSWRRDAIASVALAALTYGMFRYVLNVPLPAGPLAW